MSSDTEFEISIHYKGKELVFPAEYLGTGYSYKINVELNGSIIAYEPDEERNFRALVNYDDQPDIDKIDRNLVEAIGLELISLFKDA